MVKIVKIVKKLSNWSGHVSSLLWSIISNVTVNIWKFSKNLKIFQKSENLQKIWKSFKNLKTFQKSENLLKIWKSSKNLKIFQKSENLPKNCKSSKNHIWIWVIFEFGSYFTLGHFFKLVHFWIWLIFETDNELMMNWWWTDD